MSESVHAEQDGEDVLTGLMRGLQQVAPAGDDAACIDQIRRLEEIKSAAAAAQATVTAAFVASRREAQRAAGVREERCEQGIAAQVGLARRCSPFQARRYVGWARILTSELSATFARLQAGQTTERRAFLVARETVWLSREDRAQVDAELAPQLEKLGDKRTEAEVKNAAYRLDPKGFTERLGNATKDRRVSLRPAPDTMARLSALLPVAQGVAAHTTLARDADAQRAAGDTRTRNQIMADLLVERLTGESTAAGGAVEVSLTMDIDTLLAPHPPSAQDDASLSEAPAWLEGYGPIPAPLARSWLLDPERDAPVWLRRLFTRPSTGQLIGMESRRRLFTSAQARFIRLRDRSCRTPYCDAPIRHIDHITPAEVGGPTSISNGQGLCAACNYTKENPGWRSHPEPSGTVVITTPTGHRYRSEPPQPPGTSPPTQIRSPIETRLAHLVNVDFVYAAA